ncbi:hypothetical protein [Gracilibacillus xinjiangensis]|uniref:Uncharacterized protein n=1 Tax=Gracilibacillus xinjiangensis TaxID=1193282 RepID=A0ABV8WXS0_9BACI
MDQEIKDMLLSVEEIKSEIQFIRATLSELDTEDILTKMEPFIHRMEEEFHIIKKEMERQNLSIQQLKESQNRQQSSFHSSHPHRKRSTYSIPSSNGAKLF